MGRFLKPFFAVLVLLVGIVAAIPFLVDVNNHRETIQSQIESATGLSVRFGSDIQLKVFPKPYISLNDLVVERDTVEVASLQAFDLELELTSLLTGQVQINAARLQQPRINYLHDANGNPMWMTEEIQTMMEGGDEQSPSANSAIAIQKISVMGGQIVYEDGKRAVSVDNIFLDFNAEHLSGPFHLRGTFNMDNQSYVLNARASNAPRQNRPSEVNFEIKATNLGLGVGYNGLIISENGAYGVEGKLSAHTEDFGRVLRLRNTPMPKNVELVGVLSGSMADLELRAGELKIEKGIYPIAASFKSDENAISYELVLDDIPQEGSIFLEGKSTRRGLTNDVRIMSKNLPLTAQSLLGSEQEVPAVFDLWRDVDITFKAETTPGKIDIKDGAASLDGKSFGFSGEYDARRENTIPTASFLISADELNLDQIQERMAANKGEDVQDGEAMASLAAISALSALSLPFDLSFDFTAQKLVFQKNEGNTLRVQGGVEEDAIAIERLSIDDYLGASVSLEARIGALSTMEKIAVLLSIETAELPEIFKAFDVQVFDMASNLSEAVFDLNISGDSEKLEFLTNLSVAGGKNIFQGAILTPFLAPEFKNMVFQVTHPKVSGFARALGLDMAQGSSFQSPLDIFTRIEGEGGIFTVSDITAQIGASILEGRLTADVNGEIPFIDGTFSGTSFDVSEFMQRAESESVRGLAANRAGVSEDNVKWSRHALDLSWMHAFNTKLDLRFNQIRSEQWVMDNPLAQVALNKGSFTVNGFDARVSGGTVNADFTFRSFSDVKKPAVASLDAKFRDVSVNELLRGFFGSEFLRGNGRADMDLALSSQGLSPSALVYDLSGTAVLTGENVALTGVDFFGFAKTLVNDTRPTDTLLGIWGNSAIGGQTSFNVIDGEFVIEQGVVDTKKFQADGDRVYIDTMGTLNLPEWSLDTTHEITVKQPADMPPFTMHFKGPIDQPVKSFGQGALQGYVERKLGRKLERFLSDKLGDKLNLGGAANDNARQQPTTQPRQQQQTQQDDTYQRPAPRPIPPAPVPEAQPDVTPEEALRGILDGIFQYR